MRFFVLCALFAAVIGWFSPVWAEPVIIEVPVDATGKDAAQAREIALAKGEQEAFNKLMLLLDPENKNNTRAQFNPSSMVTGFEIADEKISANRYRGIVRYSFDADKLQRGVNTAQAIATEPTGTGVMILPVLRDKGRYLLWESNNRWRDAWNKEALVTGQGNIILPLGDLTDMGTVDGNTAPLAGYGQIVPLLQRYGATDAIAPVAILNDEVTPPTVEVKIIAVDSKGTKEVVASSYAAKAGETTEQLLARVVSEIAGYISAGGGNAEALKNLGAPVDAVRSIAVNSKIDRMDDWVSLREKLQSIPSVVGLDLMTLSNTQVSLAIHFKGEAETLVRAMLKRDIVLQKNDKEWVLIVK